MTDVDTRLTERITRSNARSAYSTHLYLSVAARDYRTVAALLRAGADPSAANVRDGTTPLHCRRHRHHRHAVRSPSCAPTSTPAGRRWTRGRGTVRWDESVLTTPFLSIPPLITYQTP
jgi:hypothetical protein